MSVVLVAAVGGVAGAALGAGYTKARGVLMAAGGSDSEFDSGNSAVTKNALLCALWLAAVGAGYEGVQAERRFEEANICPHLMASMESGSNDVIIIERDATGRYDCTLR